MKYGSICSGVEAASLAWKPLGWEPAFFAEVEPFPCAVLQQKFGATKPLRPLDPSEAADDKDRKMRENWLKQIEKLPTTGTIPNLGDFTKIKEKDYNGSIDVLVGGTPCQDLSMAGKRKGFDGKRSCLAKDFVRLAYELNVKICVWENVPGALSSNQGRDFSTLLSLFTGCEIEPPKRGRFNSAGFVLPARKDRFGVAWRVLDARFVRTPRFPRGIPQRRRRLFLVGYFGSWAGAAKILLERAGAQRDHTTIRKAEETASGSFEKSLETNTIVIDKHSCYTFGQSPALEKEGAHELHFAAFSAGQGSRARGIGYSESAAPTIRASASGTNQVPSLLCVHGSQDPIWNEDHANAIGRNQGQENILVETGKGFYREAETAGTLEQHEDQHRRNLVCNDGSSIRRLTPLECERLMGFPDNHTRISWNGKPTEDTPDSARYKACGNSMCVNCMEWIGLKINMAEGR